MRIPRSKRLSKTSALLMCGAAIGGATGYAASASGTSNTASTTASSAYAAHGANGARHHGAKARGSKRAGLRGLEARMRHAVSASVVVSNGHGQFATVSLVRGTLVSISGSSLTVREGTARSSYKTVTLSLPADAVVRIAHARSSLSALSAGEHVLVIQGPKRTLVAARPGS